MQFLSRMTRRQSLVLGCLVCVLFMVGATVVALNRNQSSLPINQIKNKTSALQVVSVSPAAAISASNNGAVTLTVKNVLNGKNITGLIVDNGIVQMQVDFLALNETLIPSMTYSFLVPPKSPGVALGASEISVLAAILDDQTYDGDEKSGKAFLDRRSGQKRELELLLPVLKKSLLKKEDGDAIKQCLIEIEQIPHPHQLALPSSVKSGSHEMRERITGKLQDYQASIKKTEAENRHFLGLIYQEYARILSKLQ